MVTKIQQESLSKASIKLRELHPECRDAVGQWVDFKCDLNLTHLQATVEKAETFMSRLIHLEEDFTRIDLRVEELNDKVSYLSQIVERHIQSHIKVEKK